MSTQLERMPQGMKRGRGFTKSKSGRYKVRARQDLPDFSHPPTATTGREKDQNDRQTQPERHAHPYRTPPLRQLGSGTGQSGGSGSRPRSQTNVPSSRVNLLKQLFEPAPPATPIAHPRKEITQIELPRSSRERNYSETKEVEIEANDRIKEHRQRHHALPTEFLGPETSSDLSVTSVQTEVLNPQVRRGSDTDTRL